MAHATTAFPEDLELREAFTLRLLGHDFRTGPLFTPFCNPWDIALIRAELRLHTDAFHTRVWGGFPSARRCLVGIDRAYPVEPGRFPLAGFRAVAAAEFATLYREEVLGAFIHSEDPARRYRPDEVGDVLQVGATWYGVVVRREPRVDGEWGPLVCSPIATEELEPYSGSGFAIRSSGTIAAARLDAVAALALRPSREQLKRLIENGGGMVNYRTVTKGATQVATGDIISLRGFPSIRVEELTEPNKRGRVAVTLSMV